MQRRVRSYVSVHNTRYTECGTEPKAKPSDTRSKSTLPKTDIIVVAFPPFRRLRGRKANAIPFPSGQRITVLSLASVSGSNGKPMRVVFHAEYIVRRATQRSTNCRQSIVFANFSCFAYGFPETMRAQGPRNDLYVPLLSGG